MTAFWSSLLGLAPLTLLVVNGWMPARAMGQAIDASPDTTVSLSSTVVGRDKAATDDQAGGVMSVMERFSLPSGADLTAFDRWPEGFVFSPDIAVDVQGVVISPGDVALYTTNPPLALAIPAYLPKLVFSAAQEGVPAGVHVDAVSRESDRTLLLSFDTTVQIDGVTFDDEDVAAFSNGIATMRYDGSAQGLGSALDLDAVHRDLATGKLLLSFDISGSVGGVSFDDEDVLAFAPGGGTYAMLYDGSAEHPEWGAADLDATALPFDTDGDGIPDGKDNCGFLPNSNQADGGGVATAVPDGIGTGCQCGDVNNNGVANGVDGTIIKTAALNLPPFTATNFASTTQAAPVFVAGRCDVNSNGTCNGVDGIRVSAASLGIARLINLDCPGEVFP